MPPSRPGTSADVIRKVEVSYDYGLVDILRDALTCSLQCRTDRATGRMSGFWSRRHRADPTLSRGQQNEPRVVAETAWRGSRRSDQCAPSRAGRHGPADRREPSLPAQPADSTVEIDCIPVGDGGGDEAQARCAETLVFEGAVSNFPLTVKKHRAPQCVARTGMAALAQRRIGVMT
jgi:hypothetical protein